MPHQDCFSSNQQISFRLHDFFSTSDFCRVGSLLPERSRTKKKNHVSVRGSFLSCSLWNLVLSRNQETSFFLELCQKMVLLNGEIKHLPERSHALSFECPRVNSEEYLSLRV